MGESFTYYRGHLADDIARAGPRPDEKGFTTRYRSFPPGAPTYQRMLRDIYHTAQGLAAVGILELSEFSAVLEGRYDKKGQWILPSKIIEYVATAKKPPIEDLNVFRAIKKNVITKE